MIGLKQFAASVRTWFQGKKTILGGGVLIAAGVAGVALGKVSVVDGMTLVGFGVSICGFSAKTERHQSEMLSALQAVATAGVDLRLGNKAGAIAAVEPVLIQGFAAGAPEQVVAVVNDAIPRQSPSVISGGKF
jgi:hypothetical protein